MGGLKMLNIKMYIKGLKLSWIRRIIKKDLKITKVLLSSEKIDITQLFLFAQSLYKLFDIPP
jgi:hypothetical protein